MCGFDFCATAAINKLHACEGTSFIIGLKNNLAKGSIAQGLILKFLADDSFFRSFGKAIEEVGSLANSFCLVLIDEITLSRQQCVLFVQETAIENSMKVRRRYWPNGPLREP